MPAVLLHRRIPGCGGPHSLLRGCLRSLQLLGFLGLHRTHFNLRQPCVLDLLVSGKPRVGGRAPPRMRLLHFAEQINLSDNWSWEAKLKPQVIILSIYGISLVKDDCIFCFVTRRDIAVI
ncbi:Hypothetical predicted protein [Scomber scombrus]|uniref:Uncharacterized protein n=1 Tax=Scomber scombrus TaxID=13677 RepID=A0AAV1PGZ3_SCOSC